MRVKVETSEDFVFFENLLNLFGLLAERKGLDDLAEEARRMAYEMEPNFTGFASSLAALLSKQGRIAEALEVIADGLEHLPDDPGLIRLRDRLAGPGGEQTD